MIAMTDMEIFERDKDKVRQNLIERLSSVKTVTDFLEYLRVDDIPMKFAFDIAQEEIRKRMDTRPLPGTQIYIYDGESAWRPVIYYEMGSAVKLAENCSDAESVWGLLQQYVSYEKHCGDYFDDAYTSSEVGEYIQFLDEKYAVCDALNRAGVKLTVACSNITQKANQNAVTLSLDDEVLIILYDIKHKSEAISKKQCFIHEFVHVLWHCKNRHGFDDETITSYLAQVFQKYHLPLIPMTTDKRGHLKSEKIESVVDSIAMNTGLLEWEGLPPEDKVLIGNFLCEAYRYLTT